MAKVTAICSVEPGRCRFVTLLTDNHYRVTYNQVSDAPIFA